MSFVGTGGCRLCVGGGCNCGLFVTHLGSKHVFVRKQSPCTHISCPLG